jgi:hypothetical protein
MDQNKGDRQERNQNEDLNKPNQNANKEQAEGSRDTAVGGQNRDQAGQGGGITNRPLDREQREQEEVPPRGRTRDEDNNA